MATHQSSLPCIYRAITSNYFLSERMIVDSATNDRVVGIKRLAACPIGAYIHTYIYIYIYIYIVLMRCHFYRCTPRE